MKKLTFFSLVLTFLVLGCASTGRPVKPEENRNEYIYWVNSLKRECVGVAPRQCLQIQKGGELTDEGWQFFYDTIKGLLKAQFPDITEETEDVFGNKKILRKPNPQLSAILSDPAQLREIGDNLGLVFPEGATGNLSVDLDTSIEAFLEEEVPADLKSTLESLGPTVGPQESAPTAPFGAGGVAIATPQDVEQSAAQLIASPEFQQLSEDQKRMELGRLARGLRATEEVERGQQGIVPVSDTGNRRQQGPALSKVYSGSAEQIFQQARADGHTVGDQILAVNPATGQVEIAFIE